MVTPILSHFKEPPQQRGPSSGWWKTHGISNHQANELSLGLGKIYQKYCVYLFFLGKNRDNVFSLTTQHLVCPVICFHHSSLGQYHEWQLQLKYLMILTFVNDKPILSAMCWNSCTCTGLGQFLKYVRFFMGIHVLPYSTADLPYQTKDMWNQLANVPVNIAKDC